MGHRYAPLNARRTRGVRFSVVLLTPTLGACRPPSSGEVTRTPGPVILLPSAVPSSIPSKTEGWDPMLTPTGGLETSIGQGPTAEPTLVIGPGPTPITVEGEGPWLQYCDAGIIFTGLPIQWAIWTDGGDGLAFITEEGRPYSAGEEGEWRLMMIDSRTNSEVEPTLVDRPTRPFQFSCLSAPASRLATGATARVSGVPAVASRLRGRPGLKETVNAVVGPGAQVRVVEGPSCADGLAWWRVREIGGDGVGWAAEADWQGAWLVSESR